MKRLIGTLGVIVAMVALFSCEDENSTEDFSVDNTLIAIEDASTAATVDAVYEDIDDIVGTQFSINSGTRISDREHGYGDCVIVTEDKETGTKTIDFGDGCEGRRGIVRKGKIIITVTGTWGEVGFTRVVTFEDFFVDDLKIEGVRTLAITDVTDNQTTLSIMLAGGKLTFADSTEVTRDADKVKVITKDNEDKISMTEKYGTTTGINKDGLAYSYEVEETDPVTHLRDCREEGTYAPVSGTLTISIEGEEDKIINYGDGECDNIATVTQGGTTEEIEVDARRKRRLIRRIRK